MQLHDRDIGPVDEQDLPVAQSTESDASSIARYNGIRLHSTRGYRFR